MNTRRYSKTFNQNIRFARCILHKLTQYTLHAFVVDDICKSALWEFKKKWEKNPKDVHIVTMDSGVYDSSVYMFSLQINRPAQFLLRWDCWKHRGKYQSAAILRNIRIILINYVFLFSSDNCLIRMASGQGSDNDTHPKCNSAFGCYEPKTSFCL